MEAIGINTSDHDIRFVEDNWESPTLGAWGVGWEVWLNGMEITQFTYFQQCGGYDCKPVSVELTYGLERLAMFIQNKTSVYDLVWQKPKRKLYCMERYINKTRSNNLHIILKPVILMIY